MLYDIGTDPGKRLPAGNIEPLYKPATARDSKTKTPQAGSKPGTSDSKKSQVSSAY